GGVEWGNGASWGAMCLPYLDQGPLFNKFNWSIGLHEGVNKTTLQSITGLPFARCPSDSQRPPAKVVYDSSKANYVTSSPTTSYFGNGGPFQGWSDSTNV